MRTDYVVLLTATIAPKSETASRLKRADPAVRLGDYEKGLRFWLGLDAPWLAGLVFAENSGYPLDALRAVASSANPRGLPVEFLSFDDPGPPDGLSYGYSEFQLVRGAIARSGLVARNRYVAKVTGRYTFPDISRLVRRLPEDYKVAVDARCARPFSKHRHFLAQFALAIFDRNFFTEALAGLPERMVPAPPWTRLQFIETVLYDALSPRRADPGIILRWPCNCEPRGIGSNGDDYSSLKKRAQAALRAAGRIVAPAVWI